MSAGNGWCWKGSSAHRRYVGKAAKAVRASDEDGDDSFIEIRNTLVWDVIRCSQNEGRKLNHMEVASEKRRAQDPIGKCHPKTLFNLVVDVNRIPCLYRRGSQAARSCRGESREEEKGPRGFRRAISRKGSRSEFDIGAGKLSDLLSTSLSTSMTICEMTICKHDYLQGKN